MKACSASVGIALILLALVMANTANAQPASPCVENSPERRGEVGCSIIENKFLPEGLQGPLFWHIDSFDSLELARTAVGPTAIAFEAAGRSWLMTIESKTSDHHGGQHVTEVGPLPLSPAPKYSMEVRSAVFKPGMYSVVHHHSGVEAIYLIEGEACYETPAQAARLRKGETLVIPAGTFHRAVATGSTLRYVLSVNLHDSSKTPTMRMEEGKAPQLVKCK
jgi:quercetin dioxygenase-like cupin family protein